MTAQEDTREALFDAIKAEVEFVKGSNLTMGHRVGALKSLALAYRYASGGPQPGGAAAEE